MQERRHAAPAGLRTALHLDSRRIAPTGDREANFLAAFAPPIQLLTAR